ncbi:MAG: acyl-ACP thioesterase [Alistipes sp.]|nr:acyl-ACP thioesterase [Alistipes sp.]
MKNQTTYRYQVATQDVDFTLRATIDSLGNYILNTAGIDAQGKGFGVDALSPQNLTWVLSKFVIEIDSRPEQFAEFDLTTWVNQNSRLVSTRNFTLSDMDGNVFIRSLSQWCMLDYVKRVPVNLQTIEDLYAPYVCEAESPCEAPLRLRAIEAEVVKEHRVAYSDIDFNRHMNTMRYIGLMVDMLDIELLKSNRPMRIDVHFMNECLYGQTLKVGMQSVENQTLFEVTREDGVVAARAAFSWR